MSLTLSTHELDQLSAATALLVSPLDHATVDDWRSAVNRQLRELLCADSAGFLMPVPDGLAMYSEEHDPRELARYTDFPPPPLPGGVPVYLRLAQIGVATAELFYAEKYDAYLQSAYYNEYQVPNRAYDALGASMGPGGSCLGADAALQFWHDRPNGRRFAEREMVLLRLLLPALRAGVQAQLRWGRERTDLLNTLDGLGQPALVCDLAGRPMHTTPALEAHLALDSEAEDLRSALLLVARGVSVAAGVRRGGLGAVSASPSRDVRTQSARYRLTGCLYAGPSAGGSAVAVVGLERVTPVPRSEEDLRTAFSLTHAEVRVALLIGDGKSNLEIAEELNISPHTVRRHTERVLRKMNARSRAEVITQLYS